MLKYLLSRDEQLNLFSFIQKYDATDWKNIPDCMNPSPKTLDLMQDDHDGSSAARTVGIYPNNHDVVILLVKKAIDFVTSLRHQPIQSLSMAVIQYCPSGTSNNIGSCFPPHIDHCNDGSWVVLFSLGCTALFQIRSPDMSHKETIKMESGDVLVFDPSSEAAVLHGVDDMIEESCNNSRWTGLGKQFEVLRYSRLGVQCRVTTKSQSSNRNIG